MSPLAPGRREAVLLGLGQHRAERTLTNADLEARLDTTDEWIRRRTGIVTRRLAGPEETIAGAIDRWGIRKGILVTPFEQDDIRRRLVDAGFAIERTVVEAEGLCAGCRAAAA